MKMKCQVHQKRLKIGYFLSCYILQKGVIIVIMDILKWQG